ncbi:argininosuccinate lyase [Verrucomicrobium sp. GAS474]|uniref:argininosuccinate lyase n=1 Tax=Verrucomicrobium sp. GAS474 TaxID=1882831 RepID=UPI00087D01CB|nr:argininosuccinate lyase [Verrucomicrobium sp. GAS474]SDU23574.1 argininosuccinate lyase [Verrucomicrobium sp. GAS474]
MSAPADQANQALWGGRFTEGAAALLQRFSQSVSFDWRLYKHDIRGSIAHATMLLKIGILTQEELDAIASGLRQIEDEIDRGAFAWAVDKEDVHMNIEAVLTARVPAGAKLHTGRSRNDQVATDMRLWIRDEIARDLEAVRGLQKALVAWAERDASVVIPGYTHLQRAQPVTLGHHLLAYVEMLERDAGRLADASARANVLPLGSGAIAGSTLPLDRAYVAQLLGFARVSENSMDSVSDRDFIVEYAAAAALAAVHLSRFSEDLILWSSAEFDFIRLPDAYTTGSSLMPQKKNPDVAELVRGKSGRVVGNLMSLLTLLKGLPMTYNRDLQEDKERLFDTADTLHASLEILAAMLEGTVVKAAKCRAAASDPLLLATDLADWLVKQGMPFRQAHHAVGAAVGLAEKKGVPLNQLSVADLKTISDVYNEEALALFDLDLALTNRLTAGAPNPASVAAQVKRWKEKLA